jgi:hypothetical protein
VHHLGHLGVKRADDGAAQAQAADDKNTPAPMPADDKGRI